MVHVSSQLDEDDEEEDEDEEEEEEDDGGGEAAAAAVGGDESVTMEELAKMSAPDLLQRAAQAAPDLHATALFVTGSMANHSCAPNASAEFVDDSSLHLVALTPSTKEQEEEH